jgi:hypothetical protein
MTEDTAGMNTSYIVHRTSYIVTPYMSDRLCRIHLKRAMRAVRAGGGYNRGYGGYEHVVNRSS